MSSSSSDISSSRQLQITSPVSSKSTSSTISGPKSCRVVGCPIPNCTLAAHRRFSSRSQVQRRASKANTATVGQDLISTPTSDTIARDGVDGLPAIPIQDPHDHDSRALFHHFFDIVFKKLVTIFRGPVVAGMTEYKQRILSTALESESYCSGLIVQAQTDHDIARGQLSETRSALDSYAKSVQAFRKLVVMVQKTPHPLQVELALLSICSLLSYDLFHQRNTCTMMHWKGLQQLVAMRGGIDNVTVSMTYVVHADRLCAQCHLMPPAYTNKSASEVILPRPLWSWYGAKFLTLNHLRTLPVSSQVINHCVDTCGLIGLWELARGDRATSRHRSVPHQPPSLEYLYYIRDRIDEQFTILHAMFWNQESRDKYFLWTARILEYPYTWSNYIPSINLLHCNTLVSSLKEQDLRMWDEDIHMLTWILYALAVVPHPHNGKQWVMEELQKILASRLGIIRWPRNWQLAELRNVQSFVWCDSTYATRFKEVCSELESNITGGPEFVLDPMPGQMASPLVQRPKEEQATPSM